MSTLAEQLRLSARNIEQRYGIRAPLLRQAADEIERLQALERGYFYRKEDAAREPKAHAAEIEAAHPIETGRHELYEQALNLVSERSEKYDLVLLVNWLLARIDAKETSDA